MHYWRAGRQRLPCIRTLGFSAHLLRNKLCLRVDNKNNRKSPVPRCLILRPYLEERNIVYETLAILWCISLVHLLVKVLRHAVRRAPAREFERGGGVMFRFVRYVAIMLAFLAVSSAGPTQSQQQTGSASDEVAAKVICNVVVFVQRLGLPIMTGVILGASIMAIFGKMAWASIVVLVVFTAIFFGAGKLMQKFAAGLNNEFGKAEEFQCVGGGKTKMPGAAASKAVVAQEG